MYGKIIFIALALVGTHCLAQTDKKEMPEPTVKSLQSLANFQWQNRIILIKDSLLCEDKSVESLHNATVAIDERHVLWFMLCDGEVQSNYSGAISNQFSNYLDDKYFDHNNVNVILIGKDGGVKSRTDYLNLDELFALIDSMPMRQSEMRRQF